MKQVIRMTFMIFGLTLSSTYVAMNKRLKENTQAVYWVFFSVLLILYVVFGIIL